MNPTKEEDSVPQKVDEINDDNGDEEDVPGDFFDDFLKEDFMAGLDIVDEDEGDEDKLKKAATIEVSEDPKNVKKCPPQDKHVKAKKSKIKADERESRRLNKKHRDDSMNADESDVRRDPKKTKRDIERDKAKCEKDKEKKIITEKLKLVETGLVPPGMEMETDLEDIKKKEKGSQKGETSINRSVSISLSPENPTRNDRIKNKMSPRQRLQRSTSRRSPVVRRSPRRSPRRPPSRRRSPRRSRSPVRTGVRRSVSPYYRGRRSRHSPGYSRHSPDRDFLRRRRSRSGSPKRRREEKKSFLQEIADKLNETRPPVSMVSTLPSEIYHQPMPVHMVPPSVSSSAPMPQQYPLQQSQQYDPYDQNFFIGAQNMHPLPVQNVVPPLPLPITPATPILPSVSLNLNLAMQTKHSAGPLRQIESKEDITKLFQDKKITLSEFLAITAKPEVYAASPVHIQEKIKVISRCQEAIKILGNSEKKFSGPLIVRKSDTTTSKRTDEEKYVSPLIRHSRLTVPFSEVPKKDLHQSAYTTYINRLLKDIGVMTETVVEIVEDPEEEAKAAPPPAPIISNPEPPTKHVQTEPFKCAECEKRNRVAFRSAGVQCGGDGTKFSVATQVREEDFYGRIPKNQSLAALTPAQLLAKSAAPKYSRNVDVDDFDLLMPRAAATSGRYPPGGGGRGRPAMDDRMRFGYGGNYY